MGAIYRPRFTIRRRRAALAALKAILEASNLPAGWPDGVTRKDLEGAIEAIDAMADLWTTGREP